MREILFRGKCIATGEWVYGYLVDKVHIGDFILCDPVRPETVGQFTGLIDKNSKKIFEGDIVKFAMVYDGYGDELVGHITYEECCFCVKENKRINCPSMELCHDFEVIGNIHDNPELIGGAEDAE